MRKAVSNPVPIWALHWQGNNSRSIVSIACGGRHTLFLLRNGDVYSCGSNEFGQCGRPILPDLMAYTVSSAEETKETKNNLETEEKKINEKKNNSKPIDKKVLSENDSKAASHNGSRPSILEPNLSVGERMQQPYADEEGEEIVPDLTPRRQLFIPMLIETIRTNKEMEVVKIAAGHQTSFLITALGDVYAWGRGTFGVLGIDDEEEKPFWEPQLVAELQNLNEKAQDIKTMGWHVLVKTEKQECYAWGRNHKGQCGIDEVSRCVAKPTRVPFTRSVTPIQIDTGWEHCAAIVEVTRLDKKKEIVIFTWGNTEGNRLGAVNTKRHYYPQENARMTAFQMKKKVRLKQLVCGGAHNVVLFYDGTMCAWGDGNYGQLGNGNVWSRIMPISIPDIDRVTYIAAGLRHNLCIREGGEVLGWGWNGFGELGANSDTTVKLRPYSILPFRRTNTTQVFCGERHSIAITSGKALKCSDEEELKPWFQMLDDGGRTDSLRAAIKDAMKGEGIDGDYLDHRNAIFPGQPGMDKSECRVDPEKYALKWCLDTQPKKDFLSRSPWPTRYSCKTCKMVRICMTCARKCHRGHGLVPHFQQKQKGENCDCGPNEICRCRWTPLRQQFSKWVTLDGEYVMGSQLRAMLEAIRYGQSFNAEDLENAYSELCLDELTNEEDIMKIVDHTKISWFDFEKWYVEYFSDKDLELEENEKGAEKATDKAVS